MTPNPIEYLDPDDLRIVNDATFIDDDGGRCVAVYSFMLDAVTFVDAAGEERLLAAGVAVIDSLPGDTE